MTTTVTLAAHAVLALPYVVSAVALAGLAIRTTRNLRGRER